MTTVDPAAATPSLDARIDAAMADYERHTAAATAALAEAIALVTGRPSPSDTPILLFAGSVQPGDQVQWADGWWLVTDATSGDWRAEVVLTLARTGFQPLEIELNGNDHLTTVRASA